MSGQSEEGFECPDFIKRNSGKADGSAARRGDRHDVNHMRNLFFTKTAFHSKTVYKYENHTAC